MRSLTLSLARPLTLLAARWRRSWRAHSWSRGEMAKFLSNFVRARTLQTLTSRNRGSLCRLGDRVFRGLERRRQTRSQSDHGIKPFRPDGLDRIGLGRWRRCGQAIIRPSALDRMGARAVLAAECWRFAIDQPADSRTEGQPFAPNVVERGARTLRPWRQKPVAGVDWVALRRVVGARGGVRQLEGFQDPAIKRSLRWNERKKEEET